MKSTLSTVPSPEEKMAAAKLVEDMLFSLIAQRRKERSDDLVSFLIDAVVEDETGPRPFSDLEIMQNARLVMVAGGGTSWRQFGIVLFALLSDPEQMALVKADRSLVPAAIQESVRWSPTITLLSRYVMRDCELEGLHLPAGSIIEASLSGANRDPAGYEDPHRFDLRRKSQAHLGFGIGAHVCLGRNVAATELVVGINAVLDAFPDLRLDPDHEPPFLTGGVEQQGVSALKVLLN